MKSVSEVVQGLRPVREIRVFENQVRIYSDFPDSQLPMVVSRCEEVLRCGSRKKIRVFEDQIRIPSGFFNFWWWFQAKRRISEVVLGIGQFREIRVFRDSDGSAKV